MLVGMRPSTRLTLVAALAALSFVALSPSAMATIKVGRGMAGVRMNMTQAQVRAVLGEPRKIERTTNDFGPHVSFVYAGKLRVGFQGGENVSNITTTGTAERLNGVGVGSTERAADRLRGFRCKTYFEFRTCYAGSFEPGRIVTDFVIRRGKVVRASVGRVID